MIKSCLFIGGTFDETGGRSSGLAKQLAFAAFHYLQKDIDILCTYRNGGHSSEIPQYLEMSKDYDCVFWLLNVPNDFEKFRDVKSINPTTMLITSKRNNDEYTDGELVMKALATKSNLLIEFSKVENSNHYHMRVLDPLGCLWFEGDDPQECMRSLVSRLRFLETMTRQKSYRNKEVKAISLSEYFDQYLLNFEAIDVPQRSRFVEVIRDYAELLQQSFPEAPTDKRFLGNASIKLPQIGRCTKTMPSFKQDDIVYVSKRNVSKRFIELDDFVPVWLKGDKLYYAGDVKPSVDSPIQLRLYNQLPKIRYMIHIHSYVKDAPFTKMAIPCGAIEEVNEVLTAIQNANQGYLNSYTCGAVNLKGHGAILFSDSIENLKGYELQPRPMLETMC